MYREKYLKYKLKYMELKKQLDQTKIIHYKSTKRWISRQKATLLIQS